MLVFSSLLLVSVLLILCWATRAGGVKRGYALYVWLAQAVVYVLIAPSFTSLGYEESLRANYGAHQLAAFLLFLVPAVVVYAWRVRGAPNLPPAREWSPHRGRIVAFSALLLLYATAYVVVSLRTGAHLRRVGSYAAAVDRAGIDPASLILLRNFDFSVLPVTACCLALWMLPKPTGERRARFWLILGAGVAAWLMTFIWVSYLNSRAGFIFGAIVIAAPVLMSAHRRLVTHWKFALIALVLSLYGVSVVMNLRQSDYEFRPSVLNPVSAFTNPLFLEPQEWIARLDGLDLIDRIDEGGGGRGKAWGRAWEVPVSVNLGQLVLTSTAKDYKYRARTTAKSYLLEEYTNLEAADYYSCCLTDLYGNFGWWGYPFGGALLGWLLALASRLIQDPLSYSRRVVGLFLFAHIVSFEQEFINILIGWVKALPMLGLVLLARLARERGPESRLPDSHAGHRSDETGAKPSLGRDR